MASKTTILLSGLAAAMLVAPSLARAAEGDLDPSFGSGGTVLTPIGASDDVANALTIDSQGRIVAAGWTHASTNQIEYAVARYTPTGALDTSFGGGHNGTVSQVIGGAGNDMGTGVAIDSQGRIVVAGDSLNASHFEFGLMRLLPDGSVDTSFNSPFGIALTAIGPGGAFAGGVAVDSHDRPVVAGYSFDGSHNDFTIARYTAGGVLDTTFNASGSQPGVLQSTIGPASSEGSAVAVDAQDRIVVGGITFNGPNTADFAVARYLPSGALDTSFGGGAGYVTTPIGPGDDQLMSITIDQQGRIVAAGYSDTGSGKEITLVRYLPNGDLDTSYGNGGKVTTPVGSSAQARAVAIDAQGRPVVAGLGTGGFLVARYQANGALDPTFGAGGIVSTTVGSSINGANAIAIDSNGKIVAAGDAVNGSNLDFALARYIGDQTPPVVTIGSGPANGSFTKDSTPTFTFSSPESTTTFSCGFDSQAPAATGETSGILPPPSCSSPFTPSAPLADGSHTFGVTGTDPAGNTSAPVTRSFTVDTKAPKLRIAGKRTVRTHKAKARAKFKLKASEPVSLKCKLDRGKLKRCKRSYRTPKLRLGKHKLKVVATDRARNVSHKTKRFKVVRKK